MGVSELPRGMIPDPRWVAIFANPFSGSGPTRRHVDTLVHELAARQIATRVLWDPNERTAMLQQGDLADACRCIVAVGGDGTVSSVINELKANVPLVTLPMGNENLFARELGYPACGRALAEIIATGQPCPIDLGVANSVPFQVTRAFSLMVSAGVDADVIHRVQRWRSMQSGLRRVSRLSYFKPIVRALRSYPYPAIVLEADGESIRGTHAVVFNIPGYAFRLRFAPSARVDDGLLDWLVFQRAGAWPSLSYAWSVMRGRHLRRGDVRFGQARRIAIRPDDAGQSIPTQWDGEEASRFQLPLEIVVRPGALTVLRPA